MYFLSYHMISFLTTTHLFYLFRSARFDNLIILLIS